MPLFFTRNGFLSALVIAFLLVTWTNSLLNIALLDAWFPRGLSLLFTRKGAARMMWVAIFAMGRKESAVLLCEYETLVLDIFRRRDKERTK